MAFITFDYKCTSCNVVEDRLLNTNHDDIDHQVCRACNEVMIRQLSATRGFVKGTATPCRIRR